MKITEFTYEGPDSDDEMRFECKAAIQNNSDFAVEMVKTNTLIMNGENICVKGSYDDEVETFIDPKDTDNIDVSVPWSCKSEVFGKELGKIKVVADAILYRREFAKLGTIETPKNDNSSSFISKKTTISGLIDIHGVVLTREKPDEDGDIRVEIYCGLRNISNTHIEKASIQYVRLLLKVKE